MKSRTKQQHTNHAFAYESRMLTKASTLLKGLAYIFQTPPALLGTLSKDVFERRTSTGSEALSPFICLDANKLVLLSFFSLLKTIYPRVSTKPLPNDAKSPLPVDVRAQKRCCLSSLLLSSFYRVISHPSFFDKLCSLVL